MCLWLCSKNSIIHPDLGEPKIFSGDKPCGDRETKINNPKTDHWLLNAQWSQNTGRSGVCVGIKNGGGCAGMEYSEGRCGWLELWLGALHGTFCCNTDFIGPYNPKGCSSMIEYLLGIEKVSGLGIGGNSIKSTFKVDLSNLHFLEQYMNWKKLSIDIYTSLLQCSFVLYTNILGTY